MVKYTEHGLSREDGQYLALAHCRHVGIWLGVARFFLKGGNLDLL